jgi:hypothetical protein
LSGWPSVTDSEVKSRSAEGVDPEDWGRCSGKVTQLPYWLESGLSEGRPLEMSPC